MNNIFYLNRDKIKILNWNTKSALIHMKHEYDKEQILLCRGVSLHTIHITFLNLILSGCIL